MLSDLLSRWAALAPDECGADDYSDRIYYLRAAEPAASGFWREVDTDEDEDRAFILWHVLACARRRAEAAENRPPWHRIAQDLGYAARDYVLGGDDPAEKALSVYVQALESLAPAEAQPS